MANLIRLKRSSVAAKVPLTTDLEFGEIAMNTNDGALYMKKKDGTDPEEIIRIGFVSNYTDLTDTPSNYTAWKSATIRINETEDGNEFVFAGGNLGEAILTTVPTTNPAYGDWYDATITGDYTNFGLVGVDAGSELKWNNNIWVVVSTPAGTDTFTELTDTPSNYIGSAGEKVVVNAAEDGLEFISEGITNPTEGKYNFSTQFTPNDGDVCLNNVDPLSATEVRPSNITRDGKDYSYIISNINIGDVVSIQDTNSQKHYTYIATGESIDEGSYHRIPVIQQDIDGSFNDNERVELKIVFIPVNEFTELKDTPDDYIGHIGKAAVVNQTEGGLEFQKVSYVSIEDELAGNMNLAVVTTLPVVQDANTIYFITT